MTLIDDYLKEQSHFSNKYGERTIVLMQVGHFYECYGVDNQVEQSNSANLYRFVPCFVLFSNFIKSSFR